MADVFIKRDLTMSNLRKSLVTHLTSYKSLYFLLVAAFVIRLFFLQFRVLFTDHDSLGYIGFAQKIMFSSSFFSSLSLEVGPLYPLFVRLFSEITQYDLVSSARLVSVIFGTLILVPFFLIVKSSYDQNTAIIASTLLTCSAFLIEVSVNALTESSFLFFFFSALWCLLLALRVDSNFAHFFGGLCLSLCYLIRPEAILFFPIFFIFAVLYENFKGIHIKRIAAHSILFCTGFLLISGPYLLLVHQRLNTWTISGKTKSISLYHGVDRADPFWYEKNFFGLTEDGTSLKVEQISMEHQSIAKSFLADLRSEARLFLRNLYYTYAQVLSKIFRPFWFVLMGFGIPAIITGYVSSRSSPTVLPEVFLTITLVSYIFINSLHNLALRHFAPTVPIFIILAAVGITKAPHILKSFAKVKVQHYPFVPILLLSLLLASEFPVLIRPIKVPGRNALEDSFIFKNAGEWIKTNLPPNPRIMSRKLFLPYYANGEWVELPFADLSLILNYAKAKHAEYLDINTKQIKLRPQLRFLLDGNKIPSSLELIQTFEYADEKLKLYKIKYSSQ